MAKYPHVVIIVNNNYATCQNCDWTYTFSVKSGQDIDPEVEPIDIVTEECMKHQRLSNEPPRAK